MAKDHRPCARDVTAGEAELLPAGAAIQAIEVPRGDLCREPQRVVYAGLVAVPNDALGGSRDATQRVEALSQRGHGA